MTYIIIITAIAILLYPKKKRGVVEFVASNRAKYELSFLGGFE